MSETSVRGELARRLAGAGRTDAPAARVTTARVVSVSAGSASCVIAGDSTAQTRVRLAGTTCSAGQTLAVVGQGGRWFAVGVLD